MCYTYEKKNKKIKEDFNEKKFTKIKLIKISTDNNHKTENTEFFLNSFLFLILSHYHMSYLILFSHQCAAILLSLYFVPTHNFTLTHISHNIS